MGSDRRELIVRRLEARLEQIQRSVPPIKPGAAHWLVNDAGPSYCAVCVRKARAAEMGLVEPPTKPNKFTWNYTEEDERAVELLDEFEDGIDGGFDTHSDSTQACETCGCTLSYILTDYGVESEIDYYCEAPLCQVRDEDVYALDRLTLNIWAGSSSAQILGASIAVSQAWRLLEKPHDA